MTTKEYDRYSTSQIAVMAGIILLFGGIISAVLWNTTEKFSQVHEASFIKVVAAEAIRSEILEMEASLGFLLSEKDPVIQAALREQLQRNEQQLYVHVETLGTGGPNQALIDEIMSMYEHWKPCRDEVLAAANKGRPDSCLAMLKAIDIKVDILAAEQYKTSDQEYHTLLQQVRSSVIALVVLTVVFSWVLGAMAIRIRKASTHYNRQIEEAQLLYNAAVETMPDPLILVENDTGQILSANPAAESHYGYTVEELLGMRNVDLSGEPHETAAAGRSDAKAVPLRWHRRKDGSLFPVEIRASRFVWQGKGVHLAWIHDVSDRISNEQRLIDAANAAKAGERAKTSFLANISHEIRTPMNGLLGALQLMEQSEADEDQLQLMHIGIDSAQSLVRLLENTLDYSQMEAGQLELRSEPFSVVQEVCTVASLFTPASKLQGLTLETAVDEALYPCYYGDGFRIRQVLINLVSNALKFTEKGTVLVSADPLTDEAGTPSGIVFCVSDSGCGIRPEDKAKIFQRFAQVDNGPSLPRKGVGLGLAIVEELVSLMGGEIHVESVWNQGSRFIVSLPLKPCEDDRELGQTTPLDNGDTYLPDKARILVIEDDDISRYLVVRILEKRGYAADGVNNSAEALLKLKSHSYRLILMDLQLPDKTGFELTADVRTMAGNSNSNVPIIAMTAYDDADIRAKCRLAGMQDYLTKPVLLEPLFTTVERWIRQDRTEL